MQTHFNVTSLILVFQVVYNCSNRQSVTIGLYTKAKIQGMNKFIYI
jgi:hypothetical protein